ncbi:MAG: tetratricopeptide (TPR) repeat protein [Planctomycetota bacterium]|jgi:tetratricopeptide (TPR) repeat protein
MRRAVVFVLLIALALVGGLILVKSSARQELKQSEEERAPKSLDALLPQTTELDSIEVAPADPSLELGVSDASSEWADQNRNGILLLNTGLMEEAVAAFEKCHAGNPQEPVFGGNLAEALARLARSIYESGEEPIEIPIGYMERAVKLAPERADLVRLLERWKKTAKTEEDFWTDETLHFLLSYDGNRSDVLKHGYLEIETMLETAYDELGLALNHYPVGAGDPKVRVVFYKRAEFAEITGIGHWAGGAFDGVIRIPLGEFAKQRSELKRILRHELVHFFVRSLGGKQVPAWLNEGLAQWFEETSLTIRSARVEGTNQSLKGLEFFPLAKLRGTLATMKDENDISRAYAQSLAFVDYLARIYGDLVLYEMVKGCKTDTPCAETFHARMGVLFEPTLGDLHESLK